MHCVCRTIFIYLLFNNMEDDGSFQALDGFLNCKKKVYCTQSIERDVLICFLGIFLNLVYFKDEFLYSCMKNLITEVLPKVIL